MSKVTQSPLALVGGWALRGGEASGGGKDSGELAVVIEGGRIAGLGPAAERSARRRGVPRVDLDGAYVAAGLVDIHTHGAGGVDFFRAGRREFAEALLEQYVPHGVTTLLASLYPAPARELLEAVRRVAGHLGEGAGRGVGAGIHLEGPFLSAAKPGALPRGAFRAGDRKFQLELLEAGGGWVRTQTIAPEVRGALGLFPILKRRRVAPFVGHTAADLEGARRAFRSGARAVTHLFNAMEGIHHRAPGPVAAALLDDRVAVELIADGFHVAPEALRLVARCKPSAKICLVSDSAPPCGLKEGAYQFAGGPVRLAGGRIVRPDGTLAGSALTLDRAVRLMVKHAGVSPAEAIEMASASPARAAGLRGVGILETGAWGNLVVLDDRLRVRATYLRGERVHGSARF